VPAPRDVAAGASLMDVAWSVLNATPRAARATRDFIKDLGNPESWQSKALVATAVALVSIESAEVVFPFLEQDFAQEVAAVHFDAATLAGTALGSLEELPQELAELLSAGTGGAAPGLVEDAGSVLAVVEGEAAATLGADAAATRGASAAVASGTESAALVEQRAPVAKETGALVVDVTETAAAVEEEAAVGVDSEDEAATKVEDEAAGAV